MGVPKRGVPLGDSNIKDYGIWLSVLGPLCMATAIDGGTRLHPYARSAVNTSEIFTP